MTNKKAPTASQVLNDVFHAKGPFKVSRRKPDTIIAPTSPNSGKRFIPSLTRSSTAKKKLQMPVEKVEPVIEALPEPFCKIEDRSYSYQPIVIRNFIVPTINYFCGSGPVFTFPEGCKEILSTKTESDMSQYNRSHFCEICDVYYNQLEKHCITKKHKDFARNDENYASLDKLISSINKKEEDSFSNLEKLVIKGLSSLSKMFIQNTIQGEDFRGILRGTTESIRHSAYKKGGAERRDLVDTDLLDIIPENMSGWINREICSILGSQSISLWEYAIKVLIPEAVIVSFSEAMEWSKLETENLFEKFFVALNKESGPNNDDDSDDDDSCYPSFKEQVQKEMAEHQKYINLLHEKINIAVAKRNAVSEVIEISPQLNTAINAENKTVDNDISREANKVSNKQEVVNTAEDCGGEGVKDVEEYGVRDPDKEEVKDSSSCYINVMHKHGEKDPKDTKKSYSAGCGKGICQVGSFDLKNDTTKGIPVDFLIATPNKGESIVNNASEYINLASDEAKTDTSKRIKSSPSKSNNISRKLPECVEPAPHNTKSVAVDLSGIIPILNENAANNPSECIESTLNVSKNISAKPSKYVKPTRRVKCPVCNIEKTYITRHLREKHKWTWESAAAATGQFELKSSRKEPKTEKQKVDYHYKRMCPITNCLQVRTNMPEHLQKRHKIPKGPHYYKLLKEAPSYSSALLPKAISESPRKQLCNILLPKPCATVVIGSNESLVKHIEECPNDPANIDESNIALDTKIVTETNPSTVSDKAKEMLKSFQFSNGNTIKNMKQKPLQHEKVDDCSDKTESDSESYDSDLIIDDQLTSKLLGPLVENLIEKFSYYMIGPDRNRKERSINVIVGDVRRIFVAIGMENDVSKVFKNGGTDFRDNYLVNYCSEKQTKAASIKKYLYSLKDFCDFLVAEDIKVEGVVQHDIHTMIGKIQQWRKNYKTQERLARHIRLAQDQEMLVTQEQVSRYNNCENAAIALLLFEKLSENSDYNLSQHEYCLMRDHLCATIHFTLAQRSGVTANMTIDEFWHAKEEDNGRMLIDVWDHKTVENFGSAKVLLSKENYRLLKLFVDLARTQTSPKCNAVFLSWAGKKLSSGDVSKRLHLSWERAGNFENRRIPKNLTANIVRKSASTGLRERNCEHLTEAANLMTHSLKTAEDHYYLRNMEKSSLIGSKAVTKLFQGSTSPKQITPKKRKTWSDEEVADLRNAFGTQGFVDYQFVKEKCQEFNSFEASPRQVYDKLRFTDTTKKLPGSPMCRRSLFSENDLVLLRTYGKELIAGGSLTPERVSEYLDLSGLTERYTISQLRTRINYERSRKKKKVK